MIPWTRKWLVGVLIGSCATLGFAQEVVAPRVDFALVRGLEFLATQQQNDGAFAKTGPKLAITSLCVLALLSSGHVPEDGRYGLTLRRAVDYLLQQFPPDGYVGKVDGSRMYGQGMVTLALAEVYGVEHDPLRRQRIRQCLIKAVEVIVAAQNVQKDDLHAGGWRYEPNSPDSDLSLSGWNALALRACNNVGVSVNRKCIDRAIAYVLSCYRQKEKGFAYQPGRPASPGMTGVGILDLCLLDQAARPEVADAAIFLLKNPVTAETHYAYYSLYYSTSAAFQAGDPIWAAVWKTNSELLVWLQQDDGGWPASKTGDEPGRIYASAMATLTLSAPNRLLPVHQR